jgi:hypothetical protein
MQTTPAIRDASTAKPRRGLSSVTTGRRLHVKRPGDTAWSRRFRDVFNLIVSDLGGYDQLSEGQRQLSRRAATISIACEKMEGEAASGEAMIDGEPLREPREIELFKQCTGRTKLPSGPVSRLIGLVGRRGGKDRFMSSVAVWRAALCANWNQHISAGEGAVVLLLGADRKQASILRRYCHGLLQSPLLGAEVVRKTDEIIEFRNGASLEIITNDARLVRG